MQKSSFADDRVSQKVIAQAIATAFDNGFSSQKHIIYAVFAEQSPGLELMLRGNAKVRKNLFFHRQILPWGEKDAAENKHR